MPKCPECGEPFEGKPETCPNCGAKFQWVAKTNQVGTSPANPPASPHRQLHTNRSLIKYIFLNLITIGIYGLVLITSYGDELNVLRVKYGFGKRMGFWGSFFLSLITLGIPMIVFVIRLICDTYNVSSTVGSEAKGSKAWVIIASILLCWTFICPLIAIHQLFVTMNKACEYYNQKE